MAGVWHGHNPAFIPTCSCKSLAIGIGIPCANWICVHCIAPMRSVHGSSCEPFARRDPAGVGTAIESYRPGLSLLDTNLPMNKIQHTLIVLANLPMRKFQQTLFVFLGLCPGKASIEPIKCKRLKHSALNDWAGSPAYSLCTQGGHCWED